jgi:hypothetical protein
LKLTGKLSGFSDLSSFDAARTNLLPLGAALRQLHPNRLQVWIKPPRRSIVCVRNIIPELRTLAADFATFGHDL